MAPLRKRNRMRADMARKPRPVKSLREALELNQEQSLHKVQGQPRDLERIREQEAVKGQSSPKDPSLDKDPELAARAEQAKRYHAGAKAIGVQTGVFGLLWPEYCKFIGYFK